MKTPGLICIDKSDEPFIWAAVAILGGGAFALGYLSGLWGWI